MLDLTKQRCEAVFISDLHLHPEEPLILARFNAFIDWAATNARVVYILGDFFHAWAGDDGLEPWSEAIAKRLLWLSQRQVPIYFMHGNRDFLVGKQFARLAGIKLLAEPAVIQLGGKRILLVHGDRYCTKDRAHQWFRKLTRNSWFSSLFLRLPYALRAKMVAKVRTRSQMNNTKTPAQMDLVKDAMLSHLHEQKLNILIHGHTHKPGLSNYLYNDVEYSQYVLSDWDENPNVLCYYNTNELVFKRFDFTEDPGHVYSN